MSIISQIGVFAFPQLQISSLNLPKNDSLQRLAACCEAKDFSAAKWEFFFLLSIPEPAAISNLHLFYNFLFDLIPHFSDEEFERLKVDLPSLLELSTQLSKEQFQLAIRLAERQTIPSCLDFFQAIDFLAKARQIAESLNDLTLIHESHRLASLLLLKNVRTRGYFNNRLDQARRMGKRETFKHILLNVAKLKSFCCKEKDKELVRELYDQAKRVIAEIPQSQKHDYILHGLIIVDEYKCDFPLSIQYPTQIYQNALMAIREQFKSLGANIRNFQAQITRKFQEFFQLLMQDAICLIGPPPCCYDIRATGSLGREELCPFSDLELMILVDQDDDSINEYFTELIHVLDLQVRTLGETTTLRVVFTCIHKKNPSGLHLDLGSDPMDRIRLPEKMAELQQCGNASTIGDPSTFSHMALKSLSLSHNNPSLFEHYQSTLKIILNEKKEKGKSLRNLLAERYIKKRIQDYQGTWPSPDFTNVINVKKKFVELLHYLLADMSLYWEIDATNTIDIIAAFVDQKVFTEESGQLLKKAAENIYALRVRLHIHFREQNELVYPQSVIPGYVLQQKEIEELQEAYWLVLYPLYESLTSVFVEGKKLEEVFKLLDLPLQAAKAILQGVKTTKEAKKAQSLVEVLERYPNQAPLQYRNRSGFSLAVLASARKLQMALSKVTTQEPEESLIVRSVKQMKITTLSHICYLKPKLFLEMCDNEGNIKQNYPGSAHSVFGAKELHFKQKPTHPLMEFAIHNLFFRIAGDLTPATILVRCEVQVKGKTEMYPVLISQTIPGKTLKEAPKTLDDQAWVRWTWMLLCSILTRPGDGRFSNYVLNSDQMIFCIDNDIAFVEPVISHRLSKTINFCSALFCLFPQNLDHEVLEQFCTLDIDAILTGWIEDVIAQEKAYVDLFTEAERKTFYDEDPNNRFKATILFREGTVALLNLQFCHLQNYLRSMLSQNQKIFPLDLLRQIVVIQKEKKSIDNSSGEILFKTYERALLQPLKDRLQSIVSRNQSMASPQSDQACLGKIPTLEEIDKKELFTPTKAKEELFMTLLTQSGDFISKGLIEGKKMIRVSFENIKQGQEPDHERQALVLYALIHLMNLEKTKPVSITIHKCAVLDSNTLESILYEELEYLELRLCNQLKDKDVELIAKKCPRLKSLYLFGSPQLKAVTSASLFATDSLLFPNLEQLYMIHCNHLSQIKIRVPSIKRIKIHKNSQLKLLQIETDNFPWLDVTKCTLLDERPILKQLSKNILCMKENDLEQLFDNFLQPASWFALAEIARESHDFKKKLFQWIELSKKDPLIATKAANAISILNFAGFSFLGRDFRGIRIPGANLNGAILTKADLQGADLRGADLSRAILDGAILEEAFMSQAKLRDELVIFCFDEVSALLYHPQKKWLIGGCRNGFIQIRDAIKGRELKKLEGHTSRITSLTLLNDGEILASGSADKTIRLWDLKSGRELKKLVGHTERVTSLTLLNDEKTLASGSADKTIRLWDLKSGRELKKLEGHTGLVTSLTLLNDREILASGSEDHTIRLWDLKSGRELKKLVEHTSEVTSLMLLNDGKTLASGSWDKTIRLWDLKSGRELKKLEGHTDWVVSLTLLNDREIEIIASGSKDHTIRLWDLKSGRELKKLEGHAYAVTSLTLLNDGETLASGSKDHTIRLWDLKSGRELKILEGHTDYVTSLTLLNDGEILVSGSWDKTIRLWDLKSDRELKILVGHTDQVTSLTLLNHEKTLASGSWDKTIRLWDLKSGRELKKLEGHTGWVTSLTLLNDREILASGSEDHTIRLWDLKSGREFKILEGHTDQVTSLTLLNDGETLASGSQDKTIRLWDLKSGRELKKLVGYTSGWVTSLTLLNDGKTLASGSDDSIIRLWDLESGRALKILKGHTNAVTSLTLLNDGKTLASGSRDKTICFWNLKTAEIIFTMHLHFIPTSLKASKPDLLYAGDDAGGLWCWQLGELCNPPLLLWATYPIFTCIDANIENCVDLSEENRNLMIEYGAKKPLKTQSDNKPSS